MFYRRDREPLPRDGIHLAIMMLLGFNVVLGVALMLLGGEIWKDPGVSRFGSWLALLSAGFYIFFRWFQRREAQRRQQDGVGGDSVGQ